MMRKDFLKRMKNKIYLNDLHFYIKFHSAANVSPNFPGTIQLPGLSISATLVANWLELINLCM